MQNPLVPLPPVSILTDPASVLLGAIKAIEHRPGFAFYAATCFDAGTFTLVVGDSWAQLSDLQRVKALEHEAGHIVGRFWARMGDRTAVVMGPGGMTCSLFNVCHDAVIHHTNPSIMEALPDGVTFEKLGIPPCPAEVAYEWLLQQSTALSVGGCGREQLGDTGEETDEQRAELAELATTLARVLPNGAHAGQSPGHGRALPEDATCPPWARHFVAWLDAWEPDDSRQRSYARESRRESAGVLLPGAQHEPGASIQALVDGSGSMLDEVLGQFCSALRTPDLAHSIVRAFDVAVQPPVVVADGMEAVRQAIARTGGGTAFQPVAEIASTDPRRVVWLTDGQSCDGWPAPHPAGELWLCTTECVPPPAPGRVVVRIE